MNWNTLLSSQRTGQSNTSETILHDRTQFQRDYDRIIFSSPFRRLQDKTQVFPLPGPVFVHNRLTHSLEVASVGRSLGHNVSRYLWDQKLTDSDLVHELGSSVAAACLAHDMGNPPFGHSGEEAISHFFKHGEGITYKESTITPDEWMDLIHFEGNANAFRMLTHQLNGRRAGGFGLTYTTVASIVKYPYASGNPSLKKYGFFRQEEATYRQLAHALSIPEIGDGVFARHPLVYLVEAADDVCYQFMDIEDAHKLKILSTAETQQLFLNFFEGNLSEIDKMKSVCNDVSDVNEQIAYLRARVITLLVRQVTEIFISQQSKILAGQLKGSMLDHMDEPLKSAMKACEANAFAKIYKHPSVVQVEIAGFQIIGTLLQRFTEAVITPDKYYSKLLLHFIPQQYQCEKEDPLIDKIKSVVDFVSAMTDVYALDLYQKLTGMGIGIKSL